MAEKPQTLWETIIPLVTLAVLLIVGVWVIQAFGIEPLLAGIIAVELLALVWTGQWLQRRGVIRRQDMIYYYFGALAVVILTWGLVQAGYLPIISTSGAVPMSRFSIYAVITASFWGILAFIIVTVVLGVLYGLQRTGYKVVPTVTMK